MISGECVKEPSSDGSPLEMVNCNSGIEWSGEWTYDFLTRQFKS